MTYQNFLMKYLFIPILLILLLSCSKEEEKDINIQSFALSFFANNDKIASFGSIEFMSILNKMNYKDFPKLGLIVQNQIANFEKGINFNEKIYFALEGPFDSDGIPKNTFIIIDLLDQDHVIKSIKKLGFELKEKNGIKYFNDNQQIIAIQNKKLVAVFSSDSKGLLEITSNCFKSAYKLKTDNGIKKCLTESKDLSMNFDLEGLYKTSNTDLNKLSSKDISLFKKAVKNSYSSVNVAFETGGFNIFLKNHFSKEMENNLDIFNVPNGNYISDLGSSEPKLGLFLDLNLNKVKSTLLKFSPNKKRVRDLFEQEILFGITPNYLLENMLNGTIGIYAYMENIDFGLTPDKFGSIPELNFKIGIPKNNKQYIEGFSGLFLQNMADYKVTDNYIYGCSNKANSNTKGAAKLKSENKLFGKKAISGFVNLKGINTSELSPDYLGNYAYVFINTVENVFFEYDINGGIIKVKTNKPNENSLITLKDFAIKYISKQIQSIIF